ncbi:MAG: hypothetical protein O2780_11115 [Proteobacteria bacterium]|jgi:hypothetical protein|nr:hypothetical protein [Pseudomonadota bacterium]MDA1301492.1 hypothetical protein [Pseudomonadota bacterium]
MRRPSEPLIVDVEASGFGGHSYPIEIGLALEGGSKFCSLIAPAPDWTHWDDEAEQVHRVSRDILETYGKPMKDVALFLNEILEGKTVYTDGWVVDKPWLTTLFHAAGVNMSFSVSPLEMILTPEQMASWHETKDRVIEDMGLTRHRASFDALIIQETYRRTQNSEENALD